MSLTQEVDMIKEQLFPKNVEEYVEERRRLVERSGEWLERYIEAFFKLSGFSTERNVRLDMGQGLPDVTHEIDVRINLEKLSAPIIVECKDVASFNKGLVDVFVGKLTDIESSAAILVTSNQAKSELEKYKNYCKRKQIAFFDGNEIEHFLKEISQIHDISKRQEYVIDKLSIQLPDQKKGFFAKIFG